MNQSNLVERSCSNHPDKQIILVCFNEKCIQNRFLCQKCLSLHISHAEELNDIGALEKCIENVLRQSNKILNKYNLLIDDLVKSFNSIKILIANKHQFQIDIIKNENESFLKNTCEQHNKRILMICNNEKCQQNKFLCSDCISSHKSHYQCLLDRQNFQNNSDKFLEKIKKKPQGLYLLLDKILQIVLQMQKKLFKKHQTSIESLLSLDNQLLSSKITHIQQFIKFNHKLALQTLKPYKNILIELIQISSPYNNQNCLKSKKLQQAQKHFSCFEIDESYPQNNFDEILQLINSCLQKYNNQNRYLLDKADMLKELKQYDESMYWYDQKLKSDPNCKEALYGKGDLLRQMEEYEQSMECLNKALIIDPAYIEALFCQGCLLRQLQKYQESINCYDKILSLSKNNKFAFNGKGISLSMLNQYKKSIEQFDKALLIDSHYKNALQNKGDALRKIGKYSECIQWYEKEILIDDPENVLSLFGKGDALRGLGKYQESLVWYDKALLIDPEYLPSLFGKGKNI